MEYNRIRQFTIFIRAAGQSRFLPASTDHTSAGDHHYETGTEKITVGAAGSVPVRDRFCIRDKSRRNFDAGGNCCKRQVVKDIFIAYGKTEDEAKQWLTDNGWEPLSGQADLGPGKASLFDSEIAAVPGIKRTDKAEEAVTDMAVMNMKGGYSLPDYQKLLDSKNSEIDEMIRNYLPIIQEFRANYEGKGSRPGFPVVRDQYGTGLDG